MVYDSYEFGKYLTELRRKYNVSMNVVCDGICDQSVMSRIENGEREVSKLVQDRLLGDLVLHRRILRIWYFLMSMSVGRFGRK